MSDIQAILKDRPTGTREAISRACNVSRGAITRWAKVPPRHAVIVSRIVGVPPHILLPDIFPSPSRELECPASDAAGQPV